MNCQMIRVISSPSISTTVPSTLIFAMPPTYRTTHQRAFDRLMPPSGRPIHQVDPVLRSLRLLVRVLARHPVGQPAVHHAPDRPARIARASRISYGTSTQIVKSHGTPSRTSVADTPSTTTGTPTGTVCHSAPTLRSKSQR